MKPSKIKEAARFLIRQHRPAFMWGPPGVGKTDVIAQLAAEEGRELRDFRLALRDPTDIKGFPMADMASGVMRFLRDDELPTSGTGILFFDEMNSAAPAVQACAMQLTLTRKIGDYTLPDGWDIIAAGNRETDRGVVSRMPSPLANRFIHLEYEVDVDDWCVWAFDHNISANTIAFLRNFRHRLHEFDPTQKAFPTPRSWAFADQIVQSPLDADTEYEVLKGTVGEGAATEYVAYVKAIRDMPSIDKILLDPDSVNTPSETRTDIMFAVVTSLVMRTEKNNFDRVMKYVNRLPTEFQVVYVKDAARRDDSCCETTAFQKWVSTNAEVMV